MKTRAAIDLEVYPNFTLIAFKNMDNGNVARFTIEGEESSLSEKDMGNLTLILRKYKTFGFNSLNYDIPLTLLALRGATAKEICDKGNIIIRDNLPSWVSMRQFGLNLPKQFEHYDISEVAPGVRVSLKLYGGRINAPKLQDLPIEPNTVLTASEMQQIVEYNVNDLDTTILLHESISSSIELRTNLSQQYGKDLMSKSDAQIAETIIVSEVEKVLGERIDKPVVDESLRLRYKAPDFIKFEGVELNHILDVIKNHNFEIDGKGSIKLPKELANSKINIGSAEYQMGVGGLHSTEKSQMVVPNGNQLLIDSDVTSYYPSIINTLGLHPKNMGSYFNKVYINIFNQRLKAKKLMQSLEADGNFGKEYHDAKTVQSAFKIVLNSSFGKFGSKYSKMYSPDLLMAVTLTGQLSLLMLIEQCELNGIKVVSANTDGFVSLMEKEQYNLYNSLCFQWSLDTQFLLEETYYKGLYSRDVNNYFAVTTDGKVKGKGVFTKGGIAKNPSLEIVSNAVIKRLTDGTPFMETLQSCDDINKFTIVRSVTGGAVCGDRYLGRVVRFIYSEKGDTIRYKKNGNKVPKSDNAYPLQNLEVTIPELDYARYEQECLDLYIAVVGENYA